MNACAQEILILTCAEHASTTSPVDELRNMMMHIKIKVLIKFGTSGILCEELRGKSNKNCRITVNVCTHMENS